MNGNNLLYRLEIWLREMELLIEMTRGAEKDEQDRMIEVRGLIVTILIQETIVIVSIVKLEEKGVGVATGSMVMASSTSMEDDDLRGESAATRTVVQRGYRPSIMTTITEDEETMSDGEDITTIAVVEEEAARRHILLDDENDPTRRRLPPVQARALVDLLVAAPAPSVSAVR
jgi:hypothetical protein